MPNPCRKAGLSGAISRLVCSVRSKRADSSQLVVQTGFPTSLADIVVKNRSRLKKSKKHSTAPDSFGCKVSEIISAVQVRDDDCALPTALDLAVVDVAREGEAELTCDQDRTRPPVLSHGEEVAATAPLPRFRAAAGAGMAWPMVAVAIMVLAACSVLASKVLVLGITTATIAILLIESIATRVFAMFTRDKEKGEEFAVEPGDGADGHSYGSESSDLLEVDRGSNSESSRKESVPRGIDGIKMEEPSEEAGKDGGGRDYDDGNYNYNADAEVVNGDHHCRSSEEAITMNKDQKMVCAKYLVLVVIVLSGLIGGRIVALGSTVAWWYLVKLTRDGWLLKAKR